MTNEAAVGSGRPIVASLVVVVAHGKALENCLDSILADAEQRGSEATERKTVEERLEVVLVDVRADRTAQDDLLRRAAADPGNRVRVLSLPSASVDEARAVGQQAARSAHVLLVDEDNQVPRGLIAALFAESAPDLTLAERLDLIAALQVHEPLSPEGSGLVRSAVLTQAEQIRALLLADPDRHGEVVAGVRERRIDLPWSVVNRGRARDLAVLYSFVPFIDTSALVAARRIRGWGVVTDVISQDMSNVARVDEASMRIPAEVLDEARIIPGKRHVAQSTSVRGFVEDVLAEVADLEATKGPYRSVYSRAMVPASHFAAAILKLRSPELRWVAEFSDPLLKNAYGETRKGDLDDDWLRVELTEGFRRAGHAVPDTDRIFGWAELVAYAFADEIIFTNQHQLDFMLGYCADRGLAARAAGISRAIHHPLPDAELYELARPAYSLPAGQVHIGYFGNFYPNRGLTEITGALDNLTLAERDRVQLHVFTSKPDALTVEILEHGLSDVVRVSPMFGYLEYLNLITRFDVLLINDYATSPHYVPNPYLPAKLADYRGSGARVWSLYEPGSVLSTLEVDHASPLGDVAAATDILRELVRLGPRGGANH